MERIVKMHCYKTGCVKFNFIEKIYTAFEVLVRTNYLYMIMKMTLYEGVFQQEAENLLFNLLGLLESAIMLQTSLLEIKV